MATVAASAAVLRGGVGGCVLDRNPMKTKKMKKKSEKKVVLHDIGLVVQLVKLEWLKLEISRCEREITDLQEQVGIVKNEIVSFGAR